MNSTNMMTSSIVPPAALCKSRAPVISCRNLEISKNVMLSDSEASRLSSGFQDEIPRLRLGMTLRHTRFTTSSHELSLFKTGAREFGALT
jgi:hypothetical protein